MLDNNDLLRRLRWTRASRRWTIHTRSFLTMSPCGASTVTSSATWLSVVRPASLLSTRAVSDDSIIFVVVIALVNTAQTTTIMTVIVAIPWTVWSSSHSEWTSVVTSALIYTCSDSSQTAWSEMRASNINARGYTESHIALICKPTSSACISQWRRQGTAANCVHV